MGDALGAALSTDPSEESSMNDTTAQPRCPVTHGANALAARRSNRDWWPKQLNVSILH